jgi:hypothetical protein
MDFAGLGWGPVAETCEHGNEPLGSKMMGIGLTIFDTISLLKGTLIHLDKYY